jgi:hypothetical protein
MRSGKNCARRVRRNAADFDRRTQAAATHVRGFDLRCMNLRIGVRAAKMGRLFKMDFSGYSPLLRDRRTSSHLPVTMMRDEI